MGKPDEVVYVGRPMADTAGKTIVIDGAITKEDLDRFMASHWGPLT